MVTREDSVEQSVQEYVKGFLASRGYTPSQVDFRDSFPYGIKTLSKPVIAAGFHADDGGEQAEMGSDLKRRVYSFEFFVIGTSLVWARNVANVIKFGLESADPIPLLDFGENPPTQVDVVLVDDVQADRQIVPDPEPWQEFIWLTTVRIEDTYFAKLAA